MKSIPDHAPPGAATVEVDALGIATVTIDGGGPLNIVSSGLAQALAATLRGLASRADVRLVVIRGSGQKTFVGGADIRELAALDPAAAREFIGALHSMCEAARDLPVPSICALRGWCIGVGLELAASCDIRIAEDTARFVMPEVRIGIPSVIQGALLSRLIGEGRARWMMLTGEAIDAVKAESWGLVTEVVAPDQLESVVRRSAASLAELSPSAMRAQKQVLRTTEAPHLDAAMKHSIEIFGAAYESDEPGKLMNDFLTKKRGSSH